MTGGDGSSSSVRLAAAAAAAAVENTFILIKRKALTSLCLRVCSRAAAPALQQHRTIRAHATRSAFDST